MIRIVILVLLSGNKQLFMEDYVSTVDEAHTIAMDYVSLALHDEAWVEVRVEYTHEGDVCYPTWVQRTRGAPEKAMVCESWTRQSHTPTEVLGDDGVYVYPCAGCGVHT